MLPRIALALAFALLASACESVPRIPLSRLAGWREVEIGRTRIVGDVPAEELQRLAGDLARFDAIFANLVGWPEGASGPPLSIHLFRDRDVAERFGLGSRIGGWAFGALDGSFITVRVTSDPVRDRNVLFHEYTHVLIARNQRTPLPPWYHEGLATFFGTVYWRSDAVVVGATPAAEAARVKAHGPLPLAALFAGSPADMPPDEISDFYATAWALTHYLLSSPSGRKELSAFMQQLAHGVPSDVAQPAAFGRSVAKLSAELATHVGYLARGVPGETLIDARKFPAPAAPPVVELDPHAAAYALGALALELVDSGEVEDRARGSREARSFLAQARDENAPDPRVEAALGVARALGDDIDGALALEQAARTRAPNDARVRLHAARVALLRAEAESATGGAPALAEAEAQYLQARALAPESASVWFGLGQTLAHMGRTDDAFAAFETARRFGWSAPLDVALARIELARGERTRAADLLRPIAQDPHAGATQKEAAELLKQIAP